MAIKEKIKLYMTKYAGMWKRYPWECSFSLLSYFAGYGLIAYVSWKIAVGVFLVSWSSNLERDIKKWLGRIR